MKPLISQVTLSPHRWLKRLSWGLLGAFMAILVYCMWADYKQGALLREALALCDSLHLSSKQCTDAQVQAYLDRPWLPYSH